MDVDEAWTSFYRSSDQRSLRVRRFSLIRMANPRKNPCPRGGIRHPFKFDEPKTPQAENLVRRPRALA